ncbi:hypothetical protein EXIGLDRAFT_709027 [Exidia glandulosa HHB12029]|uniref:Galactose-binding like protein n=1 Tax=Exidia glandulosa HHB12029 TaxID=1314781 RepID=A0A165J298_EXIGL|nr:hypothetical protein EXIGLDRAFT_709027 [Exidia glandulosa HHB12029]
MATQDTQFGDSDSHVLFTPKDLVPNADHCKNISNHECTGRWWQEGIPGTYAGSVKATWGRGTTFEITFYGSGITVLGVKNSDGGKGTFTMDGEAQSTTTDFHADSLKLNQTVYNRDGLDLSNPHTLHFRYFDASFKKSSDGQRSVVRFDSFLVQHPADVQ